MDAARAPETRLVAGCMTGTSIDSIDVALVEVRGRGLTMSARFVRGRTRSLGDLAIGLRRLADQHSATAGEIARLSREFALLHVEALRELLGTDAADLIVVHGQTVFHAPPVSWQMINPAPIARALRAPVVFDLRAADLAAGGQGAPITPLADWVLFRRAGATPACMAIVNLGGFCNITLLPPVQGTEGGEIREIEGFDVCACNQLLDGIARELFGVPFDEGGRHALRGAVHPEALEDLVRVLRAQSRARRSLGTGDEGAAWISRWRARAAPDDLAATACEALGSVIAERVRPASLVLLAGGGARNAALAGAITSNASCRVEPLDARGVPIEHREAACMAVLGALCQDRVPITLPRVTGVPAPAPVAGAWVYPS